MEPYDLEELKQVYVLVQNFIQEHDITCEDVLYQEDQVIEDFPYLIKKLCDTVGYKVTEE